ncbi:nucleoside triphosphate pyrophosphatase [Cellulomonas sp. Leaf395]|uniref:nucleoside triphosphate pyrophosphatase n=1 Tax=Cellulomonas sp. Leaf395 TaxID=1736362 RepID=UPI00070181C4|nr:nucleoside triphosphate pyrophosphatase [Cellulomonas sp. Leaf395]KQT02468.1 septum formation inhibitor Maf [Cellulomonas sp. Leaf395]
MTRLLLASASPARRATLVAAGIEPLVAVSTVDEEAVLASAHDRFGALDPADAVLLLAQSKVEDVSRNLPAELEDADDLLLLGCDSMLELDGQIYGKPVDAAEATTRWRAMRGRSGVLHTGHWLMDERGVPAMLGATSSTTVRFADLSDEEIDAYVATGEPLAVAGAFTIDGLGGPFVERIEGDHHGVVGLSLPLLRELLGEVGVSIPDLWRSV